VGRFKLLSDRIAMCRFYLIILIFVLQLFSANAAVRTWDGGGNDDLWTTPANWVGDVAPSAGDDIVFTGTVRTSPFYDYPTNTIFSSITLTGASGLCADFYLNGSTTILLSGKSDGSAIINEAGTSGSTGYKLEVNIPIYLINNISINLTNTTNNSIVFAQTINNGGNDIIVNNFGNSSNVAFINTIVGSGGLILNGPANVLITGNNFFTGGVTLNNGTLRVTSSTALGAANSTFTFNGGALGTYNGSVTLVDYNIILNNDIYVFDLDMLDFGAGPVTLTKDINIYVKNPAILSFRGNVSGPYGITKYWGGTLYLAGSNNYSGTTTIAEGEIRLGSATALGTVGNGTVIDAGGVLDLNGQNYTTDEPLTINTTAGGAIVNSSTTAASYNGPVTMASDSYINATVGDIYLTSTSNLTGDFNLTIGGAANGSISNNIDINTANVSKQGTGTWILTQNNSYTGTTTINEGKLVLQGLNCSQSYTIALGTTLEMNYNTDVEFTCNTAFYGEGTFLKTGTGYIQWPDSEVTFALSSGSLIDIREGTLIAGGWYNDDWTANLSDLYIESGALLNCMEANVRVDSFNGSGNVVSGISDNGRLIVGVDNGSGEFTGIISDYNTSAGHIGKLEKQGTGEQIISGANDYTGVTAIFYGILTLGNSNVIPDEGKVVIYGMLNLNSHDETVGSISGPGRIDNYTGGGNPTFTFGVNNISTTFDGVITNTTGRMNVIKKGTGIINLDGANTYTGQTYIEDGFVNIGGSITKD